MRCRDCPYGIENFTLRIEMYKSVYGEYPSEDRANESEQFIWCDKVGGKVYSFGHCGDWYEHDEEKHKNHSKKKRINKQYECSFGDYIFIYPDSTQDIKDEAASQNNCVASYIDKVIDGKCHILFLRKKSKPDESLVTIEVRNNHIVQARRRFNDDVTAEDQKAIDAFNKKFANKEDKAA